MRRSVNFADRALFLRHLKYSWVLLVSCAEALCCVCRAGMQGADESGAGIRVSGRTTLRGPSQLHLWPGLPLGGSQREDMQGGRYVVRPPSGLQTERWVYGHSQLLAQRFFFGHWLLITVWISTDFADLAIRHVFLSWDLQSSVVLHSIQRWFFTSVSGRSHQ
jgi:hypothetical protein